MFTFHLVKQLRTLATPSSVGCAMRLAYKVPGLFARAPLLTAHAAMRNAFMLIVGFPPSATTSTTVNRKADICLLSVS